MSFHVCAASPGHVVSWNKRLKGRFLRPGSILGEFKCTSSDRLEKIKIIDPHPGGFLKELLVQIEEDILPGTPLLSINPCKHEVVMKDMCASCGTDLRKLADTEAAVTNPNAKVQAVHHLPELRISEMEAERVAQEEIRRLHNGRKLVLLVDLDQTVIHTTQNRPPKLTKNTVSFQLTRNEPWLWTRLRPYCTQFIHAMSRLFELHIVTFGSRMYAHKIAEILEDKCRHDLKLTDKKTFFSHRILSRDECVDPFHKSGNLQHLFPCGDSMCAIIDDRGDVWKYSPNCILVKKYHFFADTGDINDPHAFKTTKPSPKDPKKLESELPDKNQIVDQNESESKETTTEHTITDIKMGDDILKMEDDEPENHNECSQTSRDSDSRDAAEQLAKAEEEETDDDSDKYLLRLQEILEKLHTTYYDKYEKLSESERAPTSLYLPDVRNICVDIRKDILSTCKLAFSGVVPNGMKPEDHRAIKTACSMGAQIHEKISSETTHLICARSGTAKFKHAKKEKIHIVNPAWLWVTYHNWKRHSESDFQVPETHENDLEDYKNQPAGTSYGRRPPRFSVPSMAEMDTFSLEDIAQMDKEVEEILSSSDDEENEVDDFLGATGESDSSSVNKDNQEDKPTQSFDEKDDLFLSDNSNSNSPPPSKRLRADINLNESSRSGGSDDDDWDDSMAARLDGQFDI